MSYFQVIDIFWPLAVMTRHFGYRPSTAAGSNLSKSINLYVSRPVYITWDSEGVKVGSSSENILLTFPDSNTLNIYAVRMTTDQDEEGWWTWRKSQGV